MVFSSMTFLYYFLPVVLLVYFVAPRKVKNGVLLLASLFFYAWGEPKYIILMSVTVLIGYFCALIIESRRGKISGKIALVVALICCLGILGVFKYFNFFVSGFNKVTGLSVGFLSVTLPIGISFYTFQLISYVVDVYRGTLNVEKNFLNLFTYVVMFPQLIAGPIVRYQDVVSDLETRKHSIPMVREGILRFVIGLGKKVLIANQLGELADTYLEVQDTSVLFAWVCAIASALQIYFDFSGYSDMAIGLGRILGFKFPENFNYPYISSSITEFWRRWHMTLGGWFRDYVYIPLGGSRVKSGRLVFNLLVVWMLTGLWHGASINFVLWGLFFGILIIAEKLFLLPYIEKAKVFNHIYVLLAVIISFVIFDAANINQAGNMLADMFGIGGTPFITDESIYHIVSYGFTLFVAIIGATPLVKHLSVKAMSVAEKYKLDAVLEAVVLGLIFIIATAHLVDGSFNPFLYFRF